jgi:PAS domain S-box-containing protein
VSANWAFYYFFRFERERSEKGLFYEIYDEYWNIPGLKENLEKVVNNNIPIYNLEISNNFPGIGQKIMSFNILRVYQMNDQNRRFLLSIKDITEKKRSEEQIRQREERYRNIFDNASDAIATVDMNDNVTSWNKGAETMFGWRADEIVGKKFGALVVPSDFYSERGRLLKEAFSGKNRTGIETVRMRKNRTKVNVSLTTSPIFDERHEIVGVSGIFRDITVQKQDEEKLKLHTQELEKLTNDLLKFQLAVEHASDLTVITDKDGIVLYANRAAIGITGYSMNEIIGRKAGIFWGKQMDPKFYRNFWNTIKKEKKIFIGEVLNKRKNGEKYYAEMRISPIVNEAGDVLFFVGLERDITQEKEIDKAKTEFVSIASHELRTPLANMSLTVEMILDAIAGPLNSEQKKYLRGIYRDIRGMSSLVDALLNVSRIELRTLVVAPEPASLYEIAENVLKGIIPQVNRKGLKVTKIFDSALPVINIDRNLMRIILQNLLLNAVKYTPSGGKIGIEIKKDRDDALIRVFDNGCGVPKDQQGKLFQKLFRARNAIDARIEGVGLGLYIVKSIVVQCGGKIWIETEENIGTIIYVRIPLEGMKKNG